MERYAMHRNQLIQLFVCEKFILTFLDGFVFSLSFFSLKYICHLKHNAWNICFYYLLHLKLNVFNTLPWLNYQNHISVHGWFGLVSFREHITSCWSVPSDLIWQICACHSYRQVLALNVFSYPCMHIQPDCTFVCMYMSVAQLFRDSHKRKSQIRFINLSCFDSSNERTLKLVSIIFFLSFLHFLSYFICLPHKIINTAK